MFKEPEYKKLNDRYWKAREIFSQKGMDACNRYITAYKKCMSYAVKYPKETGKWDLENADYHQKNMLRSA